MLKIYWMTFVSTLLIFLLMVYTQQTNEIVAIGAVAEHIKIVCRLHSIRKMSSFF
jgi:hypothetical protein